MSAKSVGRVAPKRVRRNVPICPVCVEPIEKHERVSGHQDAVMHARCDPLRHYPFHPPRQIGESKYR